MEEYIKLTKGLRNAHSASELEICKSRALYWSFLLEFLYFTTPQTSLVFEQYAIVLIRLIPPNPAEGA